MVSDSESAVLASVEPRQASFAWLVGGLAWLIPGGGHLLLGRWSRGLILLGGIMAMFLIGFAFGGHLYTLGGPDPQGTSPLLRIPPVIADFGTAGPYLICWLLDLGFTSRAQLPTSEYGNTFLWVAGLLNYLAALDAFDISVGRKP
jgi:hypothetical protein